MGHYDDLYDTVTCIKCNSTVYKYIGRESHYIEEHFAETLPSFEPYENNYLCTSCYKNTMDIARNNKEFRNDEEVEIRSPEYEFYLQGNPTGQFARGKIFNFWDSQYYVVELFCNGELHEIDKKYLYLVS